MPLIATPYNPFEALHHRLSDTAPHAAALPILTSRHLQDLLREEPACSHLHFLVLREIARNAAALDLAAASEASAIRAAEQSAAVVARGVASTLDAQGIAALKSPAIHQVLHYRAVHQRGLYGAIRVLPLVTDENGSSIELPPTIRTEADCVEHLSRWQQQRPWTCPVCESRTRYFLTEHEKFQCCCGRQYSIRLDTIFAESHVSLAQWFQLIAAIIAQPQLPTTKLAKLIGMPRTQTVRDLRTQIDAALQSDEVETLLAGLDRLVLRDLLEARAS